MRARILERAIFATRAKKFPIVITLVKHFTKLSRRFKNDWDGEVFQYTTGTKKIIDSTEIEAGRKIMLPELPRTRTLDRLL